MSKEEFDAYNKRMRKITWEFYIRKKYIEEKRISEIDLVKDTAVKNA